MRHLKACFILTISACGSVSSNEKNDANTCAQQSNAEFCSAANACEMHTGMDNCGTMRTVDCGACGVGKGCVAGSCQAPVCSSFTYTTAPIPAMARPSIEDTIGGATPDGKVILYVQTVATSGCGSYHLIVADEVTPGSGAYTQRDVYTTFSNLGLYNGQDSYAITADGLTIITVSTDRKRLMSTTRSALNMTDFGVPSTAAFDALNAQTLNNNKIFISPTLSADGLEFWYALYDTSSQIYSGGYYSLRTSTSVPFPAGTAAAAPVSDYPFVEGISSDRLTLFVFDNFTGRALTRMSTSQPFTNPNAPAAPPQIPAWQHKPLADCSKIVAMTSPGGCPNEDVVLLRRQ